MFWTVTLAVIAYAAGAFSWPYLHKWAVGAEEYALTLRDKARSIEAKKRSGT